MKNIVKTGILATMVFAMALCCGICIASDSRDYIPAAPGTNLLGAYYQHVTANDYYSDGEKVSSNTDLTMDVTVLRPVFFTQIGPFTVDPQAIIPYGDASIEGGILGAGTEYKTSGLGDPTLVATVWVVNNPESKTWVGLTPYIKLPLGEYDNSSILNMGANRWAFKGEVGVVKGFGKAYLDLVGNAEFYTDNDDYGVSSQTLAQDPLYNLDVHLSYDINDAFYAAASYYYSNGGETETDGISNNDEKDDHAVGLELGIWLSKAHQLCLQYRSDLEVENGPKTNMFGLRWFYFY